VKPFPRQLAQQGATNNQVLVWSDANQQWEPASLGDFSPPVVGEILTQDGVTPLTFLTTEAEDEYLYEDI
jgi:hypothetical protein